MHCLCVVPSLAGIYSSCLVYGMGWVNHGDMWWDTQPIWGMPGIGNEKQYLTLGSQKIICPWGIMIMRILIIYNMNLQ